MQLDQDALGRSYTPYRSAPVVGTRNSAFELHCGELAVGYVLQGPRCSGKPWCQIPEGHCLHGYPEGLPVARTPTEGGVDTDVKVTLHM